MNELQCPRCKETLIPFERNGKVVPNAWLPCKCFEEEPEHYHEITPNDFDFPVSWDMHRWICATYGKGDPGPDVAPIAPTREVVRIIENTPSNRRLDQLEGNLMSLRDILKEHVNQNIKKKTKYD